MVYVVRGCLLRWQDGHPLFHYVDSVRSKGVAFEPLTTYTIEGLLRNIATPLLRKRWRGLQSLRESNIVLST